VARNEFILHYQPKASMRSRAIEGAEALIRWEHPTLGLLYPDSFIPEAERSGLIEPMTHWVLEEALRQSRQWMDLAAPHGQRDFSMAVNLSARSLLDASLPEVVQGALSRWSVPPHLLDLEITETIIMTDPARARRVLTELADMGVTLSIDDFGTGYSSLAYLRDLPVHQLKIDRTFVQDLARDSDDEVIVRAVVDLARNLTLVFQVIFVLASGVGMVLPWKKRELYESSPKVLRGTWFGLPPIAVASGVSLVVNLYLLILFATKSQTGGGFDTTSIIGLVLVAITGIVIYGFAKYGLKRRGLDLDMTMAELPPE